MRCTYALGAGVGIGVGVGVGSGGNLGMNTNVPHFHCETVVRIKEVPIHPYVKRYMLYLYDT